LQGVTVTGPVADGTRPNAFADLKALAAVDLNARGYVAEEFFYAGQAAAYVPERGAQLAADGQWELRPTRKAGFKTQA
jgi:hypothetical protein